MPNKYLELLPQQCSHMHKMADLYAKMRDKEVSLEIDHKLDKSVSQKAREKQTVMIIL